MVGLTAIFSYHKDAEQNAKETEEVIHAKLMGSHPDEMLQIINHTLKKMFSSVRLLGLRKSNRTDVQFCSVLFLCIVVYYVWFYNTKNRKVN